MLRASAVILVAMAAVPALADPCVPHRVSIHVVDDAGGYMRAVHAQIARDEKSGALELNSFGVHSTYLAGKSPHVDYQLSHRGRDAITGYLAKLATGTKPLVLDRAHTIAFETKSFSNAPGTIDVAHVIAVAPLLDDRSFTRVSVEHFTESWYVASIGLTPEARAVWVKVMSRMRDRRVAVVIDGDLVADSLIVQGKATPGKVPVVVPSESQAAAIARRIQLARCE